MRTRQLVPVLTFVMGLGVVAAGCGSSSTPSTDGASGTTGADAAAGAGGSAGTGGVGGTSGTGGSAGTGGAAGTGGSAGTGGVGGSAGTGGTSGTGGTVNMCGTGMNSCTKAETDAYSMCVVSMCSDVYKPCFGDNWTSGTFGGVCGDWFMCTQKCACNDTGCRTACGFPPSACVTCLLGTTGCESKCPQPACFKPDGGVPGTPDAGLPNFGDGGLTIPGLDGGFGLGGTCADLKACCDATTDAAKKTTCTALYAQFMGKGDLTCGAGLTSLKAMGGYCM